MECQGDEDTGKQYFKDVYLSEYEGCIPENWLGDDVMKDIQGKYYTFFRPIVDKALEDLGMGGHFVRIAVDPSYEDTTTVVIYHPDSKRVLLDYDEKAWHFKFRSLKELEEFASGTYEVFVDGLRTGIR